MKNDNLTITDYTEAFQPKTFSVCSWTLKPFCLGHYILLEKINSPVTKDVEEDENPTFNLSANEQYEKLANFFMAVFICTMDYKLADKVLNNDSMLAKTVKSFMDKVNDDMKRPRWNYPMEFYRFKSYIKYYFDIPPFDTLFKNDKAPSGTDWKQNIFVLFRKLGYDDDQILNMSFKRIFMEWTSEAESAGGIRVLNKYEVNQLTNPAQVVITTSREENT